MTRRKTKKKSSSKNGFFYRRFREIYGGILIIFGLAIFASLVNFNPTDPSLNSSPLNQSEVSNIMGLPGAFISDLLIQIWGLASVLWFIAPIIWGYNMIIGNKIGRIWFKVFLLILASISVSAFLSNFKVTSSWPLGESATGAIGIIISEKVILATGEKIFFIMSLGLTLITGVFAAGLSFEQWRKFVSLTNKSTVKILKMTIRLSGKIWRGLVNFSEWMAIICLRGFRVVTVKFSQLLGHGDIKKDDDITDVLKKADMQDDRLHNISSGKEKSNQQSLDLVYSKRTSRGNKFEFPSVDLLKKPKSKTGRIVTTNTAISQNARLLEKVLSDFGVNGKIRNVSSGPVVTRYELEPAAGVKSQRVISLADDVARSMSAISVRISNVPGKNTIGIELPNVNRMTVYLRDIIGDDIYRNGNENLPLILGKDITGNVVVADLAKMPHLLIAGTTGAGKSVALNTMIMSLLYKLTPDECRLVMIDPKMLELIAYKDIPHLLTPVVTEANKAVAALSWAVKEMENRYYMMSKLGVRNIEGYNDAVKLAKTKGEKIVIRSDKVVKRSASLTDTEIDEDANLEPEIEMKHLPKIVIIVDEMADLMIVSGKQIESYIQRLAQMARASGIHIIMATQRPSVDVITGVIKANFPTRISFRVTSRIDSRTIINSQGAEQLLGQGDMLYMGMGGDLQRVHCPLVTDKEVEHVVKHLRTQGKPEYLYEVTDESENSSDNNKYSDSDNELYDKAVNIVLQDRKASISYIQRQLRIGYNRAAILIERMEREGVISESNSGKREILAGS